MRNDRQGPARRRFRRRTVRLLVDFIAADAEVRCEYATTLGAGGMFIETATPLENGEPIRVRFKLPSGGESHVIAGRVAWSQHANDEMPEIAPGMGIEFLDAVATATLARALEEG